MFDDTGGGGKLGDAGVEFELGAVGVVDDVRYENAVAKETVGDVDGVDVVGHSMLRADVSVEEDECVVFEDSFNGLKAGRAAGMLVVGLTTTNPLEEVAEWSDLQVADYVNRADIWKFFEKSFAVSTN